MAVLVKGRHPAEILKLMVGRVGDDVSDVDPARVQYVGRMARFGKTRYGNPFKVGRDAADNEQAVEMFTAWIHESAQEALLADIRANLRGKVLLCHCQHRQEDEPACHAQVLVRLANPAIVEALHTAPRKLDMGYASHLTHWVEANQLQDNPMVLVTGNRGFDAAEEVAHAIALLPPGTIVVQGEAEGADVAARDAALERGLPVAGFPAKWEVTPYTPPQRVRQGARGPYDVAAGHIRNQRMLDGVLKHPGQIIGCLAFTDDLERRSGTRDMASRAFAAGLTVVAVNAAGERRTFQPAAAPVAAPATAEATDVVQPADGVAGPDVVIESDTVPQEVTA